MYLDAHNRRLTRDRQRYVCDTAAAIAGALSGKGIDSYLEQLEKGS